MLCVVFKIANKKNWKIAKIIRSTRLFQKGKDDIPEFSAWKKKQLFLHNHKEDGKEEQI